ncbi:MAG: cation diffusion facilitator family transporter [Janthinobacterium lividum]
MVTQTQTQTQTQLVAQRTTWISIAINVVLVVLQLCVGALAHSQALIADGMHSLSDLVADGIVLVANKRGGALPDDDHNYGHSRYETVASFFLGALLVTVGAGMLWRAGLRLTELDHAPDVHASALFVAAAAILAKELLFRYMLRAAERVRSTLLVANAWHARSDAASSLVVALGILGSLSGYKVLDPVAASIVGFMIARMGWGFAWNALQDLSDRAFDMAAANEMRDVLQATPGVREVHAFRTRKMGDSALVDAHLRVDPRISVSEGHYIAESARARLRRDPRVLDAMIHIDPEDDDLVQVTEFGLPMRPELLERTRAVFRPFGIPVDAIDLHYLEGGIDLDVFIASRVAGAAGRAAPAPDALDALAVSTPDVPMPDTSLPNGLMPNAVVPDVVVGMAPPQWATLDLEQLAAGLGVRRLKIFFSLTSTAGR